MAQVRNAKQKAPPMLVDLEEEQPVVRTTTANTSHVFMVGVK